MKKVRISLSLIALAVAVMASAFTSIPQDNSSGDQLVWLANEGTEMAPDYSGEVEIDRINDCTSATTGVCAAEFLKTDNGYFRTETEPHPGEYIEPE